MPTHTRPSHLLAAGLLAISSLTVRAAEPPDYSADFDAFCSFVGENYAYFDLKKTDWGKVCAAYRPRAVAASERTGFITVLEQALGQLYDQHAHLATSTKMSPRLVPTNAQLWAEWDGERALVAEVRPQSAAYRAGLRPGMRVLAINGEPLSAAVAALTPRFLGAPDPQARSWALQVALAGRQGESSTLLQIDAGAGQPAIARQIRYDTAAAKQDGALSFRRIDDTIGYIRINNSLGDSATIAAFDQALDQLADSRALVLDLRDTPSGGNSLVARGIMGRLVGDAQPYQTHELVAEARNYGVRRRWTEYVMPRGAHYSAPVVVLAGRWTGSMGEGIAIGLNAARQAPVLGTPMARLLGALDELRLPTSGITLRLPTEKLFHVDGTPREAFLPCRVAPAGAPTADAVLDAAVALAKSAGKAPLAPKCAAG
jgi:C-terminal processing protease CtpA/Prc